MNFEKNIQKARLRIKKMSKEEKIVGQCKSSVSKDYIEALDRNIVVIREKDYTIIEQALQRLEEIDNANPNEALECLERVKSILQRGCSESSFILNNALDLGNNLITIKQTLIKAQEQEKENTRAFDKDIINLNKTLKQTIDKPILYVSRYGNKYIVPQKLFEEQCNVLALIKEYQVDIWLLNQCDYENYIRIRKKAMVSVGQIVNENGIILEDEITEEEFDLLKRWLSNE